MSENEAMLLFANILLLLIRRMSAILRSLRKKSSKPLPTSIPRRVKTPSLLSQMSAVSPKHSFGTILPLEIESLPGLHLGHRIIPIEIVGCYVPGGRYPLLSAPVMTIVPAKVAGCDQVIACLPPNAHPAMIAGCHLAGADRIFRVGGAQAIAAMAYGTQTIPAVDKIVGPGNAFVNEAKRQVFGQVGIDQLAGPSEIFIVADETANPATLATDMLAQAEHDVRTRVGLVTTDRWLAEETIKEVEKQLQTLSTAAVAGAAWKDYGEVTVVDDEETMIPTQTTSQPSIFKSTRVIRRQRRKSCATMVRFSSANWPVLFTRTNAAVPTTPS